MVGQGQDLKRLNDAFKRLEAADLRLRRAYFFGEKWIFPERVVMTRQEQIQQETEIAQDIHKELVSIKEEREISLKTIAKQDELLVERKKYEDMLKSHISNIEFENEELKIEIDFLKKELEDLTRKSSDIRLNLPIISKEEFVAAIEETKTKEEAMKKLDMSKKEFDLRYDLFGLGTGGQFSSFL